MPGVTTLRTKQYAEYRLSAINGSGESIKNRGYFLEFKAKLKSIPILSKGLESNPYLKKTGKKLFGLSIY